MIDRLAAVLQVTEAQQRLPALQQQAIAAESAWGPAKHAEQQHGVRFAEVAPGVMSTAASAAASLETLVQTAATCQDTLQSAHTALVAVKKAIQAGIPAPLLFTSW